MSEFLISEVDEVGVGDYGDVCEGEDENVFFWKCICCRND